MNKPQPPCKDCEFSGTLHNRCEKYAAYSAAMNKYRKWTRMEHSIDQTSNEGRIRRTKSLRNYHYNGTQL